MARIRAMILLGKLRISADVKRRTRQPRAAHEGLLPADESVLTSGDAFAVAVDAMGHAHMKHATYDKSPTFS